MKKYLILLLCLNYTFTQAQDCTCTDSFQDLITSVEENYSLFQYKVSKKLNNEHLYAGLKKSLKQKAQTTTNKSDCAQLFKTYTSFFNDGHMWATMKTDGKEVTPITETITVDTTALFKQLKKQKNPNEMLGIWEADGYRMLVMEEKDKSKKRDYVGIILTSKHSVWTLGKVKMEFTKTAENQFDTKYYMGNFSLRPTKTNTKQKYVLNVDGLSSWRKTFPLPKGVEPIAWDILKNELGFKYLGNQNYYIKISSFGGGMASVVSDFVEKNHEKLIKANTLIIDVSDNGGGNDDTYFPLLPYIYSGPVKLPTMGFWLSKKNKELFLQWFPEDAMAEAEANGELDEATKELYEAIKTKENEMVYYGDKDYSLDEIDTIYSHPKKVAIIANNNSASSAETFVYRCNQSDRVVTFGQNTEGIVDGFNGNDIEHECFTLRYPTSVRTKNIETEAIDPIGIFPDVYLDENQEDVIEFIIDFLGKLD